MKLSPGTPFGHWQVSEVTEARYDVPDQPMQGEMDPFFFLTKDRNHIPHEYPCRTQFAAERRGRRPDVRGEPAFTTNWLPFGSPRLAQGPRRQPGRRTPGAQGRSDRRVSL